MKNEKRQSAIWIIIAGGIAVALILIWGTIWMGRGAKQDTETAVRSVSLLYLDELAGRREQVVASNLQKNISDLKTAIGLMTEDDLSDEDHLKAYQARMKKLYGLEKFAFVDTRGLIYTSLGTQDNIDDYQFDYKNLKEADISILNPESQEKKVIIAVPVTDMSLGEEEFAACFMEIDMKRMLEGVSMNSGDNDATFCNIYTSAGLSLMNQVLGGQTRETNLLETLKEARFEPGYSQEVIAEDFAAGRQGEASFEYRGIQETLSYVPVEGTDWFLTYLIRESVISDSISSVSDRMITRSVIQSLLTVAALLLVFAFLVYQNRNNARLRLEKETAETEARIKREELEQRLELQNQLLREEQERKQHERMITALAADYRSLYYLDLDRDHGICYQAHTDINDGFRVGDEFPYQDSVNHYADQYVTDLYREEFLDFVEIDHVREKLENEQVISFRYMVHRHGEDRYEMVRFASVRRPEDREDHMVHTVSACFTDVDGETRKAMARNQALSDALAAAEEANHAKTAFLSSMSHEIRTPMNAIIGLDSIALNDPDLPDKTREYLEKIGTSADHLLHLINDILDMSRIESGRMSLKNEEFSFSKLLEYINTMASGQCSEKGLEYNCHITGHVDDYYIGDYMKLRQVLINILGNAVKFTPEGGSVNLTVEKTAAYEGRSTLQFVITDTGIGMSQEYLPRIFDAFSQEDSSTTSKYGSSGLGLAITRNIVELMNGHIEVESEKGVGSTFTVTVTLMDSDRSGADDTDEIRPEEISVLIIDDDPVACQHARLVLEKVGIAADIAASGPEAIEMVKLRHARRNAYNLILVDWQMPEMDGVETSRQIRQMVGDESAIIILTAYSWDDILEEAMEAGIDSFLPKPLFAASMLEEFKEAVKKKNIVLAGKKKADLSGRRILLAEDMEVNAEIMNMVLSMRGMENDLAVNGQIAVDLFASHPEGYYDAILMDMRMPEMDGLTATRTIRAMDREDAKTIPIIALTANAFDEDVQRSLQAGLNAHLTKPVQPDSLYETLESLIKD
ncbi:MAG: response regulator [Eubacterium sp.]|nr:response regulator [Eubacterium sp.]